MRYRNRHDAGQRLAEVLRPMASEHPVVLALPRGGVVVGYEVARALNAQLEVLVARKLGVPSQPELGMGAIAEGGGLHVDEHVVDLAGIHENEIHGVVVRELEELRRRVHLYREGRPLPDCRDRTVILVDDGLATGATAHAAIDAVRKLSPRRIVLAVPVGPPETIAMFRQLADEVVCPQVPKELVAVGQWYEDFSQVADDQVVDLLVHARASEGTHEAEAVMLERVEVAAGDVVLSGDLVMPRRARGLIVFAHGSGSSRKSPRNRFVATQLQHAGFATLLFDLLTPGEAQLDEATGRLRFDVDLLTARLVGAVDWVLRDRRLSRLPVGVFGASTGAAAALMAASMRAEIGAVVSRGGRPDLAASRLRSVHAPTLLIVGSRDETVVEMNQIAMERMKCEKQLAILPGATHLFEEPGALEQVAHLAGEWFAHHLPGAQAAFDAAAAPAAAPAPA